MRVRWAPVRVGVGDNEGSSADLEAGVEESAAMRDPRAMPSNIWWKRITMNRVMKKESPDTIRVRPITGQC